MCRRGIRPSDRSDNLHYEKFADGSVKCIEDEIPFELPDGWAWSKIGPLCEYITSGSRGWAQYYSETGSLFLRMGNLSRDSFDLRLDNLQRVNLPDNAEGTRTRVAENDLLFSITAEIGMLGLIPANFEEAYINQHVGLIRFLKDAQTKFFPYILMSEFCRDQYYTVQCGMKNSFRLDNIQNILAPVPPLGEQIRIAEKLSNIWTHIQQIDIESEAASDIISKAKSKILDLAIHGQLVPQDPTDEPASVLLERIRAEKEELIQQGKIKRDKKESVIFRGEDNSYYEKIGSEIRCIDSEMPFEIPDGWTYERLGNICSVARGGSPRPIENYLTDDENGLNWIKIGDTEQGGKYIFSTKEKICPDGLSKTRYVHCGDFLLTNSMSFGRPYILKTDGCIHDGWLVIGDVETVFCPDFLYYMLSSPAMYNALSSLAVGSTVKNLKSDSVKSLIVPIPPIGEQKFIADRVEMLFTVAAQIEKSLS